MKVKGLKRVGSGRGMRVLQQSWAAILSLICVGVGFQWRREPPWRGALARALGSPPACSSAAARLHRRVRAEDREDNGLHDVGNQVGYPIVKMLNYRLGVGN